VADSALVKMQTTFIRFLGDASAIGYHERLDNLTPADVQFGRGPVSYSTGKAPNDRPSLKELFVKRSPPSD
jgi:hypothetical protein